MNGNLPTPSNPRTLCPLLPYLQCFGKHLQSTKNTYEVQCTYILFLYRKVAFTLREWLRVGLRTKYAHLRA